MNSFDELIHIVAPYFHINLPAAISEPVIAIAQNNDAIPYLMRTPAALNAVRNVMDEYGAILFRNLGLGHIAEFEELIGIIAGDSWAKYAEVQSPRTPLSKNVFTSTEYPQTQRIMPHHENAHRCVWPQRIFFFCNTAEMTGGATTICDSRAIAEHIPSEVFEKFLNKGIRYYRNFGYGFGFSWQDAYGFQSPDDANVYFAENNIQVDWIDGEKLRVWYDRPAFVKHPNIDKDIWCNNFVHYHPRALDPIMLRALARLYRAESTPYCAAFGDGERAPEELVDELSSLYRKLSYCVQWRAGELLALDNIWFSHGREPFSGVRKVCVAMTNPVSRIHYQQKSGIASVRVLNR